jgi:hypothetical protein
MVLGAGRNEGKQSRRFTSGAMMKMNLVRDHVFLPYSFILGKGG